MLLQGPISVEHLETLRTSGIVQDDTLVMAHSKGPSLLKDVIAMCDGHQETSATRYGAAMLLGKHHPCFLGHFYLLHVSAFERAPCLVDVGWAQLEIRLPVRSAEVIACWLCQGHSCRAGA